MDEASASREVGKWRKQVLVDRPDHPLDIALVLRSVHKRKPQTDASQTRRLRIVLHQVLGLCFGTAVWADGPSGSGFVETFRGLLTKDFHAAEVDDPFRASGQRAFQNISSPFDVVGPVSSIVFGPLRENVR